MFKYTLIKTADELEKYLVDLDLSLVTFDTELTGTSKDDILLGISLYDGFKQPCYISTENPYFESLSIVECRRLLNPVFKKMKGLAHNAKFDDLVLKFRKFSQIDIVEDSMLMVHTYNPDLLKKLEVRVREDLKYPKKDFKTIVGKTWDKINWDVDTKPRVDKKGVTHDALITLEIMGEYSAEDTYYTRKLRDYYKPKLIEEDLIKIHDRIEIPLIKVIRDMEYYGVSIDTKVFKDLDVDLDKGLKSLKSEIYEQAGCEFNLGSPKQLGEVLFDRLKLPVIGTTKTGGRSTDGDTMDALAAMGFEIAQSISEFSTLKTLSQNFVKPIPLMVNLDGRLRCNFQTEGARTGRFSCTKPNLQNQPNNPNYPVRKGFIPAEGKKFVVLDWSQIELRMLAHCSRDHRLMEAFMQDEDIHQAVATALGISRDFAKTINFGIIYGMGAKKLALSLGISEEEAKEIIHGYYSTYEGYVDWKKVIEHKAGMNGEIKNIFGRIRRLPEARNSHNKFAYFGALRRAVNTVIQGSCADLMKIGMLRLYEHYKKEGLLANLLLVVHDEFVIEADEHVRGRYYHVEQVYEDTKRIMENLIPLRVPVRADGKVCNTWEDMKNKKFKSLIGNNEFNLLDMYLHGIV